MVGSSASADVPSFLSAGLSAATGGGLGGSSFAGSGGSLRGSAGGSDGGGGAAASGPGTRGLALATPGMNEKSSAKEDEIHGTCSWRVTPTRVRLRVSSAIRSGTRISLSNSCTNRLWSLPLSEMTELSAAEYITSVPFGAITGARPAEKLRNRRSNGLRLEASIRAILTPAPRLLISPRTVSRLKPSRRTSDSVQICASIGIM